MIQIKMTLFDDSKEKASVIVSVMDEAKLDTASRYNVYDEINNQLEKLLGNYLRTNPA